jgi:predicted RNase H-like HicB family nuclease
MRTYTAVVEKCPDTGLYIGYVPGFPGAHTQAETLDELQSNLHEVIDMLLEDGDPVLEAEFIGTQMVAFAWRQPDPRPCDPERSQRFLSGWGSSWFDSAVHTANIATRTAVVLPYRFMRAAIFRPF